MTDILLAGAGIALYYGVLVSTFDRRVYLFVLRSLPVAGMRNDDVFAVVNIVVAGAFQLAVVAVLVGALDLPLHGMLFGGFSPVYLLLAPLLAVAELSLAGMLASMIMAAVTAWQRARGKSQVFDRWQAMMQSGWLRSFSRSHAVLPRHVGTGLFAVYLACEEILFRGIALHALLALGPVAALLLSGLLFVAVQTVGMPSLGHALFPVAGALVMAPVHGCLALLHVPLAFLILTHLMFFLAAIGSAAAFAQPAGPTLSTATRSP